jgi:hypothetical protein
MGVVQKWAKLAVEFTGAGTVWVAVADPLFELQYLLMVVTVI